MDKTLPREVPHATGHLSAEGEECPRVWWWLFPWTGMEKSIQFLNAGMQLIF